MTPCLEGSFQRIVKNRRFASNFELLYSSSWEGLVESCRELLVFEALSVYKIIYSVFVLFNSKRR